MWRCDVPDEAIRLVSVVMLGGPVPMSNIMPAIVRVRLGVVPISADVEPPIGSPVVSRPWASNRASRVASSSDSSWCVQLAPPIDASASAAQEADSEIEDQARGALAERVRKRTRTLLRICTGPPETEPVLGGK